MTDATWFLEVASYVLITLFGAWLLWQKARPDCLLSGIGSAGRPLSIAAIVMARRTAHGHAAHALTDHAHRIDHATIMRSRPCPRPIMALRTPARSARPAATRMRPIRRCCRATISTGARHGRRWRRSASAPAPAR